MNRKTAVAFLRDAYEFHGYLRIKMDHRRGGMRTGWEVRLLADNRTAAGRLTQALAAIGLESGTIYPKRRAWVVPVYGFEQTSRFLRLVRPKTKSTIPDPPDNADLRLKRRKRGIRSIGRPSKLPRKRKTAT